MGSASSRLVKQGKGAEKQSRVAELAAVPAGLAEQFATLSLSHKHAALFPPPENPRAILKALREDLREVRVLGPGNQVMDVFEKFQADTQLTKAQKDRIFKVLAEVHDSYMRIDNALSANAPNKGYQIVNWKHTRAEIDQVLEAAKLAQLSAPDIEDAVLASIFSDAVKTPQNFIVHNIDGAAAAAHVLMRHFDLTQSKMVDRIVGIVKAAKEHQIGPPKFMGTMARKILAGKLGAERANAEAAALQSIQDKITAPFVPAHVVGDGSEIAFTEHEKSLLKEIGVLDWAVPHQASRWYGISRAVVDGDSLINYASPDGWAKIAALRGPDTQPWFEDATVFDSLQSTKQSYDDAMSVVSDAAKPLMEAGLARTRGALKRVRDAMQKWFAGHGPFLPTNADGTIAFWNAPLKYPSKGALTIKEQRQLDFAKELRAKVIELLRAEQGNY